MLSSMHHRAPLLGGRAPMVSGVCPCIRARRLCAWPEREQSGAAESQVRQGDAPSPSPSSAEPSTSSSSSSSSRSISGSSATSPSVPFRLMAALAAAGASETAYLTLTKLTATATACPTSGCETVLDSPYASLFGLPLPLYGMAVYSAVAAAAWVASNRASSGRLVPDLLCTGLAVGCGVLAATSVVLMYILHTSLGGASCFWCYTSAGLSFTLATTLLLTLDRRHLMDVAGPGLTATAGAALALYLGFGSLAQSEAAQDFELPYAAPDVTTTSTTKAVELAKRLKDAGAKMYGAFWCTHCYDQKQTFGRQAMVDFPYVECYPDGWKRGAKIADACEAASVKAFPTWVINGEVVEGELDLDQVAAQLDAQSPEAAAVVAVSEGGGEAVALP